MHSLKNTVVAVCLLGLSFVFYQASSNSSSDDGDLFPTVEVATGNESPPLEEIETPRAPATESLDIQFPGDTTPAVIQPPAMPGPPLGTNIIENPKSSQPAAPELLAIEAPSTLAPSPQTLQPEPADIAAHQRDQGLIDALETQNLNSNHNGFVASPPGNEFAADLSQDSIARPDLMQPAGETHNAHSADRKINNPLPFASQANVPDGSSFNRPISGDPAMDGNRGVMTADRTPDFSELNLSSAWAQVDQLVLEKKILAALQLLSRFYNQSDVTGPQRQHLIAWLDALAGKIIFSTEHHLTGSPYTVGANDSLADIGQRWGVPAQLVYNINEISIPNPLALEPGTQLKSIKGPFRAEIDLQQKVMTLFLGDLYAGRYPIRLGISGTATPGEFDVMLKTENGHSWRDVQGNSYPPESPENGYGRHWIGLTGSLCIHAVSETAADGHRGCIGLSESDAKNVFAILAKGSKVSIIR